MGSEKFHHSYPIFQVEKILCGTPGLLLVSCQDGLLILHPGTLERVTINGLRLTDGIDQQQDGFIYPQLPAFNGRISVLGVYDVMVNEECSLDMFQSTIEEEEDLLPDDVTDYGSCHVALAVNDRFVILHCTPRYAILI